MAKLPPLAEVMAPPVESGPAEPFTILVDDVAASPTNPRKRFDEAALAQLAETAKSPGIKSPILVRPNPSVEIAGKPYELIAGERRWRASKMAGVERIRATIENLTDAQVLEFQIIENSHREDVHPLEESDAFARSIATGVYGEGLDAARAIAEKIGRPVDYVLGRIELTKLIPEARAKYDAGRFTLGHARILASLGRDDQLDALRRLTTSNEYVDGKWTDVEREAPAWPVSAFRRSAAQWGKKLANAPFDKTDPTIGIHGPCASCPFRTGAATLFADDRPKEKDDACLDSKCWGTKVVQTLERIIANARERFGEELIIVGHKDGYKLAKSKLLNPWDYAYSRDEERPEGYVPVVMLHDDGRLAWAKPRNNEAERLKQEADRKRDEERRKTEEKLRQLTATHLLSSLTDVTDELPILRMMAEAFWSRCYGKPQATAKKAFGLKAKDSIEFAVWSKENLMKLVGILVIAKDAESYLGPYPYKLPEESIRIAAAFGLDYQAVRKQSSKEIAEPSSKPKRSRKVTTGG